jgi:hypothetical protein
MQYDSSSTAVPAVSSSLRIKGVEISARLTPANWFAWDEQIKSVIGASCGTAEDFIDQTRALERYALVEQLRVKVDPNSDLKKLLALAVPSVSPLGFTSVSVPATATSVAALPSSSDTGDSKAEPQVKVVATAIDPASSSAVKLVSVMPSAESFKASDQILAAVRTYDEKYNLAVTILRTTVSDAVRTMADSLKHPWEIYSAYKEYCLPKNSALGQFEAESALSRTVKEPNESVLAYTHRLEEAFERFKHANKGVAKTDEAKRYHFFMGLYHSQEADAWRTWIETRATDSSKSYADIKKDAEETERLRLSQTTGAITEGILRQGVSSTTKNGAALAATSGREEKRRCFYCKNVGHVKKDCRKFAAEKNKNGDDSKKKRKCNYCGKKGHTEDFCFKKKRDRGDAAKKSKDDANRFAALAGDDTGDSDSGWTVTEDGAVKNSAGDSASCQECGADAPYECPCASGCKSPETALSAAISTLENKRAWFLDSGASRHLTGHLELLSSVRKLEEPVFVTTASGKRVVIKKQGDVTLRTRCGTIILHDVGYAPGFVTNLISIGRICKDGAGRHVRFTGDKAMIIDDKNKIILESDVRDGPKNIFGVWSWNQIEERAMLIAAAELDLWHRRLCHINHAAIKRMHDQHLVQGMSGPRHDANCRSCRLAKAHRNRFNRKGNDRDDRATRPFQRVHADLMQMTGEMLGTTRSRYVLVIVDEYTDYVWIYLLPNKTADEVSTVFMRWYRAVKNLYGARVEEVHTDGGGEFVNDRLKSFWADEGVAFTWTAADTPQHNGIVERKNRTLQEAMRAVLVASGLPPTFWEEALAMVVFVHNKTVRSSRRDQSPEEALTGIRPSLHRMHVPGCDAYVLDRSVGGHQEARGVLMVFMGYVPERRAYKCFDPRTARFVISRDVTFDEESFLGIELIWAGIRAHAQQAAVGAAGAVAAVAQPAASFVPIPPQQNIPRNEPHGDEPVAQPFAPFPRQDRVPAAAEAAAQPMVAVPPRLAPPPVAQGAASIEELARQVALAPQAPERSVRARTSAASAQPPALASASASASRPTLRPRVAQRGVERAVAAVRRPNRARSISRQLSEQRRLCEEKHDNACEEDSAEMAFYVSEPISFPNSLYSDPRARASGGASVHYGLREDSASFINAALGVVQAPEDRPHAQSVPSSIEEAMSNSEWVVSMEEEMAAHTKAERPTWDVIRRDTVPAGKRIVPTRWVWVCKRGADGNVIRLKSRVVLKGYLQKFGEDFWETFAPTLDHPSLLVLLSLAAISGWEIMQIDIKTAFLNAPVKEEVYIELPPGFEQPGFVGRLRRALYGLKQAPRAWHLELDSFLRSIGFRRCHSDQCIYMHVTLRVILAVFVDDILLFAAPDARANCGDVKQQILRRFPGTDLGEAAYVLGLRVTRIRNDGLILLDQHAYVDRMLERFEASAAAAGRAVATPMDEWPQQADCPTTDEEKTKMRDVPYRSLIGSLLYLACRTRPDIAFAVNALAQFSANPGRAHYNAALRVLRYVAATRNLRLRLGARVTGERERASFIYADSDFPRENSRPRPTAGVLTMLGIGPVRWHSKVQKSVRLSTMEAECGAALMGAQDAVWLSELCKELRLPLERDTILYCDNSAAIDYINGGGQPSKMRHANVALHYVREKAEDKTITMQYVPTADQLADMLTKPLPRSQLEKLRSTILI